MIILYIILSIILLIFILLNFSIVLYVNLSNDSQEIKVKYLFFTLYPMKEKVEKEKNKKFQKWKAKRKRKKLEKELAKEKKAYNELLEKLDKQKDGIKIEDTTDLPKVEKENNKNDKIKNDKDTNKKEKDDTLTETFNG